MNFAATVLPPTNINATPADSSVVRLADGLNQAITAWYGTKAQIARAKADAAIAKAQGRAEYATATIGLPSPGILLLGGGALLAIALLSGRRGRR